MDEQWQATHDHLENDHGFPTDLTPSDTSAYLDLVHAALHDQRSDHLHRWVVVEFHTGRVVSAPLDTEAEARKRATQDHGPDAGKEYEVIRDTAHPLR